MEFKCLNYDLVNLEGDPVDIDLSKKDNWFYRQVEATIRFAFGKHDCMDILPGVVFVDESMSNIGIITFAMSCFTGNVDKMARLRKNKLRIALDLKETAEGNSNDEIEYRFEFM